MSKIIISFPAKMFIPYKKYYFLSLVFSILSIIITFENFFRGKYTEKKQGEKK